MNNSENQTEQTEKNSQKLWTAPAWTLAILLATLTMVGPFAMDTYLPAFARISQTIKATPEQMQQTLAAYLYAFAFMNLFHGSLSDSFGRRLIILWGMFFFTIGSLGCALSQNINQLIFFRVIEGLSCGAGVVVSRAIIRDLFPPIKAQKMMSQVTIFFGIAPAIAPMIGAWLSEHLDWHSVFWFLTLIGILLWYLTFKFLPETLNQETKQSFKFGSLMKGYFQLGTDVNFLLLTLASGVPFNGMFLYILASPAFMGEILNLAPTQFYYLFISTTIGMILGAWFSGRLAGKVDVKMQIKYAVRVMIFTSIFNLIANAIFTAHVSWAIIPIAIISFGWAMLAPAVTIMLLDMYPERRGMASSLSAAVGSTANGLVAGVLVPVVMYSALALAFASFGLLLIGLCAWLVFLQRQKENKEELKQLN